jgi:hypothetical protein
MAMLLWHFLRVRVLPLVLLLAVSCARRTDEEQGAGQSTHRNSEAREQLLRTLEDNMERAEQSPEAAAAFRAFERRQAAALKNIGSARFVMARMNPAAGLGNRMVALVSAFVLSIATDRALLIEWESYAEPRTHRSMEVCQQLPQPLSSASFALYSPTLRCHVPLPQAGEIYWQVSTMSPLETFIELPFPGDTSTIFASEKDVKVPSSPPPTTPHPTRGEPRREGVALA